MTTATLDSYSDFIASLQEVDTLLSIASRDPLSEKRPANPTLERDITNAVTRSCIVMLVAHFEGFVKSALTELIDAIRQAKPPARRIPDALLELHTRGRINEIFGTQGPTRIHRTRALFTNYAQLWDEDHSINPSIISAKILVRQFTSATPEVLSEVFSLLDISDIIPQITIHVNNAIASRGDNATTVKADVKLNEIVRKRNNVAHGDKEEKLTPVEIENYKVFLTDVAEKISLVIEERIQHCCSLIG